MIAPSPARNVSQPTTCPSAVSEDANVVLDEPFEELAK